MSNLLVNTISEYVLLYFRCRNEMLKKLVSVIGCKYPDGSFVNPDPTYVLTYDNLMKMVAIHMRFR